MPFYRLLAAAALVCAPALLPAQTARDPNVKLVAPTDPAMEAAKRRGRATLPAFKARMAAPKAGDSDFSVKFNLTPGRDPEFIWANSLTRTAGGFTGKLANNPLAKGYVLGQQVAIPERAIIDWGYVSGGVMQGHYTTRVLIQTLPAAQAAEYRQALGWTSRIPD